MRILVVGAYGLLGGYVTARLLRDGHELVGLGRDVAAAERRFPAVRWVAADLRSMDPAGWTELLGGVDAVVNCAGALQDSPRDDLQAVHLGAVLALADACAATGVRRVVHISAAGVEEGGGRFGETKRSAEEVLRATALDWVILRPGLVLAPAAYGGSALLRALAGFPGFIPALSPGSPVQVVSIDDVAEAVARSLAPSAPAAITCDLVSREPTRLRDVLLALRAWLGFRPAKVVAMPGWAGDIAARAADGLAWLGWRSPMRTAAIQQLSTGLQGHSEDAPEKLGFKLARLSEMLAMWPSGVQERWFARLYFLKPLMLATLALFWGASGVIGLLNIGAAERLLTDAGMSAGLAALCVYFGSLLDLMLAGLVCFRRTALLALIGMIAVTLGYLAAASLRLPYLWSDPLGPLVKSIPAAMLALATLAVMDER